MPSSSFMERLYEGVLDESVFSSFKTIRETEKTRLLLQKYGELLEEYPPSLIEKEGKVPDRMLQKMGEIGLFGISVPNAYGGLGFSLHEYLRIVEDMGSLDLSVAIVSLAHLSIGIKGIVLFGNEAQKQKYLVPAASGEMIFSYALTEPKIGSDAKHIETTAELSEDGTHYILNGQKTYITNANYARGLTVFAQMDPKRPGFMGAFIVETGWNGVEIGKDMPKMGLKASSTAAIRFKDVCVPLENLLGKPGEGFKIAMTILNYGRLGLGAASAGIMNQSLKDMKKRSASRIQFGVPIERFPLVREKMVKAKVHRFVISAMNAFTASMLENDPTANVAIESSHCKLFSTTRAWDTLYDALQLAGGSGYLSTQPYEKRMRDFRVTPIFEGTTEIHSIYPPLFFLRRLGKQIAAYRGNLFSMLSFYLKNLFKRMEWPLASDDKIMKKASRTARTNCVIIRRMLLSGLLLYRNKVAEKEFFLRRITTLSLYAYGILAVLAKIRSDRKAGIFKKEELELLEYFAEEAREAGKENKRFSDSKRESLIGRIMRNL